MIFMRTKKWGISIASISLLTIAIFGFYQLVQAQQAESVTLAISPQIINISANPGDPAVENIVRLTNGSDLPVEISTQPKNILPSGEDGAVDLTEDQTSYSLEQWITVEPNAITLAPNETQDFKISITVPNHGEPGGHFGTVVFRTVPPKPKPGSASAAVSQEIAPVILVSVAGEVTEEANIASFNSTKNFWTNENPITLDTRIENTGNNHFQPTGSIKIKNMFGREVTTIPLEQKNVLPSSIRKITSEWSNPGLAVGRYTADLSLVYGQDNTILTSSTTFTVFPWQTLLPAAIIVIIVMYILIKYRTRLANATRVLAGKK